MKIMVATGDSSVFSHTVYISHVTMTAGGLTRPGRREAEDGRQSSWGHSTDLELVARVVVV